jgi:hypothetical protein
VMSGVPGKVQHKEVDATYGQGYAFTEGFDPRWFTQVLINAGYRPYRLTRADNGLKQTIWCQPIVELIGMETRQWVDWTEKWNVRRVGNERERYETMPVLKHSIPYERIDMYAQGTVEEFTVITEVKAIGVVVLLAEDDGEIVNELGHVKELAFA